MILLTGGAGFIGSHIAEALLDAGEPVRVLDALLPAAHREPPEIPDDAEFVHGDLRDAETVRAALHGVDAVCHQAGMVGLGTDFDDVVDYTAHNDLGTAMLLRELAQRRFAGRLVLASSMVVYGEGAYACAEHGAVRPAPRREADLRAGRFEPGCPSCGAPLRPRAVGEDEPTEPRNVYAATKLHQEHLCACFVRERPDVSLTALRYHNVYGPRMPRETPYAGVASLWASALAAGRAPLVFEDGGQLRDFVHVRDVARANVTALCAPEPAPGVFNVASGQPRPIVELARALHAAFADVGAPEPLLTGGFRLGDVRHVFASPEHAARELGFRAREPFAPTVAELARAPLRA
ncbi:MAG TPA: NAD-dependent epimerase/dehydratase family protein [Solirubrobacteraceae bacterium]|nr:NAD-dependent epimerase/dehydratase family protein [Solirubrobacteraceae bacterium]